MSTVIGGGCVDVMEERDCGGGKIVVCAEEDCAAVVETHGLELTHREV